VDQGRVCRTRNFIPDYFYADFYINTYLFDEITIIDVTKKFSDDNRIQFARKVERILQNSMLPVTIGGNIQNENDVNELLNLGADRILINITYKHQEDFYVYLREKYGQSTIVCSINHYDDGICIKGSKQSLEDQLHRLERRISDVLKLEVGDLLINNIDRDGTLKGFNLDLLKNLHDLNLNSLLISGGLGNVQHVVDALKTDFIQGVMVSNIFHLTESFMSRARIELHNSGVNVRMPHAVL
jgi:cyclase